MSALAIGAAAAVVGTGFSIYQGLHQESEANKIKKNLKTPQYQIPDEFIQNKNIARQMAQLGLPQQQYNNQLNQINAGQAGAVAAASRSANPGAAISAIQGQTNAATNNLAAEDSQARQTNERYYLDQNAQLGGQKLAQQQANVFDPYTQKYNEAAALQGAGMQNVNTGVQDLSQLGGYALQYGLHQPSAGQTQTFGQANAMPLLDSKSAGVGSPTIQTTLPGAATYPNTYLNLPAYNPNQLQAQPFKNPYFPNANT